MAEIEGDGAERGPDGRERAAESTRDEEPPAAGDTPEVEKAPNPSHTELLARLRAGLGDDVILESATVFHDLVVRVAADSWGRLAAIARDELECDYLSFISAIDWQPAPREGDEAGGDTSAPVQPTEMTFGAAGATGRFQVFAHLQSTSRHWGITFKADVDEANPAVDSWVAVYPGADWHERECWEMFGVDFVGHPALRHLYLPSDFEGHPLRKDYALLARAVKPWPGLVDVEPMPEAPGPPTPDDQAAVEEPAGQ